jgi:hypothetical protein
VKLPVGKAEIFEFYGFSPKLHVGDDGLARPAWDAQMQQFTLPAPMKLAWDRTVQIGRITLHKKAGPYVIAWLEDVYGFGMWHAVEIYGGGYVWRLQRGSDKISMHALGAAIDIDPRRNRLGAKPEDAYLGSTKEGGIVVSAAERRGLHWGGRWKARPDVMHFQVGSGY